MIKQLEKKVIKTLKNKETTTKSSGQLVLDAAVAEDSADTLTIEDFESRPMSLQTMERCEKATVSMDKK